MKVEKMRRREVKGSESEVYVYDGKMRLLLEVTFEKFPEKTHSEIQRIERDHRLLVKTTEDGGFSVITQAMVDFEIKKEDLDAMVSIFQKEMEKLFGFPEREYCVASCWSVGFQNSKYDYLMCDSEAMRFEKTVKEIRNLEKKISEIKNEYVSSTWDLSSCMEDILKAELDRREHGCRLRPPYCSNEKAEKLKKMGFNVEEERDQRGVLQSWKVTWESPTNEETLPMGIDFATLNEYFGNNLDEEYCKDYMEELRECYRRSWDMGDFDGWTDLEDFLGRKITADQYHAANTELWEQDIDTIGIALDCKSNSDLKNEAVEIIQKVFEDNGWEL